MSWNMETMQISNEKNRRIGETITQRTGTGSNELVAGWQKMLANLLDNFSPYLKPARIVTFKHLTSEEEQLFHQIVQHVDVPDDVCGIYISASARNQMMYTNQGQKIPEEASSPNDDGALLFSLPSSRATIINVLLAHSPHMPAIDVYDDGALLAGYIYESIDDCLGSLTKVIAIHLGGQSVDTE